MMKLNLIIKIFILFNGINGVFFSSDFQIEDRTLIQEKDQIKKDESSNIIYYILGSGVFGIVIFVIYKSKSRKSNAAPEAPLKNEEEDRSRLLMQYNQSKSTKSNAAPQASLKNEEKDRSRLLMQYDQSKSTKSNAAPEASLKNEEKDDSYDFLDAVNDTMKAFIAINDPESSTLDRGTLNIINNAAVLVHQARKSDNPTQQQTTENDTKPNESPAPSYSIENNKDDKDDKDNKEPIQSQDTFSLENNENSSISGFFNGAKNSTQDKNEVEFMAPPQYD